MAERRRRGAGAAEVVRRTKDNPTVSIRRPLLKICGITRLEDARYCAAAGADFLGFIQHQASPRYVDPNRAKEIIDWVYGAKAVGVFVDEDIATVNHVADQCGFAYVQLHGDESPGYCAEVDRPVIKALRVRSDSSPEQLQASAARYAPVAEYLLLDTYHPNAHGGTGNPFDWGVVENLDLGQPYFLAGGISPTNLSAALAVPGPAGVDVSSALESSPGVKDLDLLADFFESFDAATDRQHS